MIKSVVLNNYGPIKSLEVKNLGHINLLIGPNRAGKTTFLKAVYSALKVIELYRRGKIIESDKDLLFKKLYWTFQTEKIGSLVYKPGKNTLSFHLTESDGGEFEYSFGSSAEKQIVKVRNTCKPRTTNSIFLPAKEVLSLLDSIVYERDVRQAFGFDDTYYDLAKALSPTSMGKNVKVFSDVRKKLENTIDGRLVYSKENKKWVFMQGTTSFDISLTSEGTKKIAILDTLLGNHFLSKNSVVFIDEPEAGMHPSMLVELLNIITLLAQNGLQFFIASHSYFVIKKLYLVAQSLKMSIPVISFDKEISIGNLSKEMPDNSIIEESVKLYREEMCL